MQPNYKAAHASTLYAIAPNGGKSQLPATRSKVEFDATNPEHLEEAMKVLYGSGMADVRRKINFILVSNGRTYTSEIFLIQAKITEHYLRVILQL